MAVTGTIGAASVATSAWGPDTVYFYRMLLTTDSSAGTVTEVAVALPAGMIRAAKFIPNLGATQPTNLFDATLLDSDGLDLLGAGAGNLINTGPTLVQSEVLFPGGSVYPTIAAGGNSKTITLEIVVEV